jgi:hypothetical protein
MRTIDARRILPRFRTAITVKRKAAGTYTKGLYTPAPTETTIAIANASVQPLDAEEMLLLPEGIRTRQAIKVYSPELLRTADANEEADRVVYLGEMFEVHSVEDWDDHGRFWKATCVKAGQ